MARKKNDPREQFNRIKPYVVDLVAGGVSVSGGAVGSHSHSDYLTTTTGDARYTLTGDFTTHTGNSDAHHPRSHSITSGSDHTATGSQYQLVGLSATNTLGLLNSSNDTSTSSGTPGIYFLRTDASGDVSVNSLDADSLDISGAVTVNSLAVTTSATVGTTLGVTGDTTLSSDLTVGIDLSVGGNSDFTGDLEGNFTSGTSGWKLDTSTGSLFSQVVEAKNAEFEAIIAEALRAQAGGILITPSFAELTRDFTVPQPGATGTLYTSDLTGLDGWESLTAGNDIQITTYEGLNTGAPWYVASSHASNIGDDGTTGNVTSEDFELYSASDTVITDWNDTTANNSMTTDSTKFAVADESGNKIYKTTSSSSNFHTHYDGTGYATLTNYTFTGKIKFYNANVGGGITIFSDYPNSDKYYRIRRYNGSKNFHLATHGIETTGITGTTTTTFDPADATNVNNWINFEVTATFTSGTATVQAYFWKVGDLKPGSPQIDFDDVGTLFEYPLTKGTAGIWAHSASSGLAVDDLSIDNVASGTVDTVVTCQTPTGIRDGDLLVLTAAYTYSPASYVGTPTGWTADASNDVNVGGYAISMFTKTWSTGDDTDVTVTAPAGNYTEMFVSVAAYRNSVNTYNFSISTDAASTDVDADSVTTSQYAYHVVTHVQLGADSGTVTDDSPSNYSTLTTADSTLSNFRMTYHGRAIPSGTSTGSIGFTSDTADDFAVISISITPSTANTSFSWGSAWGSITTASPGDLEDGEIAYTFTTHTGSWGAGNTARAGSLALDYGVSGDGYIKLTTLDDAGSPYIDIATRSTWNSDTQSLDPTVHFRAGNLAGLGSGFADDEWGVYIAGTEEFTYLGETFTLDTQLVMSTDQAYYKNLSMDWVDQEDDLVMRLNPYEGLVFAGGTSATRRIDWESKWEDGYSRIWYADPDIFYVKNYSEDTINGAGIQLEADHLSGGNALFQLFAPGSGSSALIQADTFDVSCVGAGADIDIFATADIRLYTGSAGDINLDAGATSGTVSLTGNAIDVTGDATFNDDVQADNLHAYTGATAGSLLFSSLTDTTGADGLYFLDASDLFLFFVDSSDWTPAGGDTTVANARVGMGELSLDATNITADPNASSKYAKIYVDSSGGSGAEVLKVRFPNGDIVTIASN